LRVARRGELLGDEDVDFLFVLTMTDAVLRDIKSLWAAFDKTDDMRITLADLRRTLGTEEGDASWANLVGMFDFDDTDGTLHYDELVAGLKQLAMSKPLKFGERMSSGSVKDWLFWMRETANAHISELCAQLVEFAGKGALDRAIREQEQEEIVEAMQGRLISQVWTSATHL
jgi:Ca2+-binding EF-hand superfamily protein